MPYILKDDRKKYEPLLEVVAAFNLVAHYENLVVLVKAIVDAFFAETAGKYKDHNDVMGCLVCSKMEIMRRIDEVPAPTGDSVSGGNNLQDVIDALSEKDMLLNVGEMNFLISCLVIEHSRFVPLTIRQRRIENFYNEMMTYWYAIHASPYEDKKIEENGDIL